MADGLDKARYFVLGCEDLIVAVDHKPLLKIFGDRSLEDISNSRLRNLKEKTLRYRFRMTHVPGVKHTAADGVSRHPTGDPVKMTLIDDVATISPDTTAVTKPPPSNFLASIRIRIPDVVNVEECTIVSATASLDSLPMKSVTWERVQTATASDDNMHTLVDLIESGIPAFRHELPTPLREYYQFRDNLYTADGVVLYNDRVVIPPSLRQEVLILTLCLFFNVITAYFLVKVEQ